MIHIIRSHEDTRRRADPRSGIALNILYDRAFGRKLGHPSPGDGAKGPRGINSAAKTGRALSLGVESRGLNPRANILGGVCVRSKFRR